MHDILKLIHVLSFSVVFGGSIAAAIMGIRSTRTDPAARTAFAGVQVILGRIGLAAIVLLWISGLWMFYADYDGDAARLGVPFAIKILAVIVATVASLAAQYLGMRARRLGVPPPVDLMKRIGQTTLAALLVAIVFAVYTFG